jgi:hypothetical protein
MRDSRVRRTHYSRAELYGGCWGLLGCEGLTTVELNYMGADWDFVPCRGSFVQPEFLEQFFKYNDMVEKL